MPKTRKGKDDNRKEHKEYKDVGNENLKKLADPRSFGPGGWLMIHILAYNATSERNKKAFERDMANICSGLKCHTCQGHCGKYLADNPMRDREYWNAKDEEGRDIGMFKWSWAFHNAVNKRLGKPILDYDTAYHLYSNSPDTVCTKDCEEDISASPTQPLPPKKYYTYRNRFKNNGLVKFVPTGTQSSYRRRY